MSLLNRLGKRLRNRQDLGRYAAGLLMRGMEVVGKFGLYVFAARALGAHDAGLFFLCLTWINLVSTVARLGMDRGITRHVAAELAVGRGRAARGDLLSGLGWTTAAGIGVTVALTVLAGPVARWIYTEPDLEGPLRLASLALVPWSMAVTAGSALAGLKRGVASQFVQSALWPVLTLLVILVGVPGLDTTLLALAGSLGLSALVGLALLFRDRGRFADRDVAPDPHAEDLPPLWQTALPLYVVELVQVSLASLPVMILGAFADPAAVGAFSVANRISMLVLVVIISIGTFAAPVFAELHRRGEVDKLRAANRRIMLTVAAVGVPGALVMLLFPGPLLGVIGQGFDQAATPLRILALAQLVNCLLPCQDVLLAMTGHGRALRRLNLLQLTTCVALGAVLIPLFGMMGAAVTTAVTVAQGAIGTALAARRGGALTPPARLHALAETT